MRPGDDEQRGPRGARLREVHHAHAVVLALPLLTIGCASMEQGLTPGPSLAGLEQLAGCALEEPAPGLRRARCADGVTVGRTMATGDGWTSVVQGEAWDLARVRGARVACDDVTLGAGAPRGAQCRSVALGTDEPVATTLGVMTPDTGTHGGLGVLTWCSSTSVNGASRCEALLSSAATAKPGAALPPPRAPPTGWQTPEALPTSETTSHTTSQTIVAGHVVVFPPGCAVTTTSVGGEVRCADDATVQWRGFSSEQAAVATIRELQTALGIADAPTAGFTCSILGVRGRCAEYTGLVGGLAWLEDKTFVVACLGAAADRNHASCRALLSPDQAPAQGR